MEKTELGIALNPVEAQKYVTLIEKEFRAAIEMRATVWDIMGRAKLVENSLGDVIRVDISIKNWRELCEAVNFGV